MSKEMQGMWELLGRAIGVPVSDLKRAAQGGSPFTVDSKGRVAPTQENPPAAPGSTGQPGISGSLNTDRGLFVALEGTSGAGKTSLLQSTADVLTSLTGRPTHIFRDPESTPGWSIANLALKLARTAPKDMGLYTNMELALLYTINRLELWSQINDCLRVGENVVCDRWIQSTLVYQCDTGKEVFQIGDIHTVLGIPKPQLTFVLTCSYKTFLERTAKRVTREVDNFTEEEFSKALNTYSSMTMLDDHVVINTDEHYLETTKAHIASELAKFLKSFNRKVA